MLTWILLASTLAVAAADDEASFSGPPPLPARAVLADGQLTVIQQGYGFTKVMKALHQGESLAEEFEVTMTMSSNTQTTMPSRFVTGYRASGTRISALQLAQLLKKETPVLIATTPASVRRDNLQLLKADVIILVLPEGTVGGHYGYGYGYGDPIAPAAAPVPVPAPKKGVPPPAIPLPKEGAAPTPAPGPQT